jgi:hypothetical protein
LKAQFCLLTLLSASYLTAATINIELLSVVAGGTVTRTIVDGPVFGLSSAPITLQAGLLQYSNGVLAYCLEPQQSTGPFNGGLITYTLDPTMLNAPGNVGGMNAAQAADVRRLLNSVPNPFSPSISSVQAAAIQVAIWEILRETAGTYDVLTGNVSYINESLPGIYSQANAWLAALSAQTQHETIALTNPTVQDLVVDAPEPGVFALIGSGFLLFAGLRRRRSS